MDALDKSILRLIYVSSLSKSDPIELIKQENKVPENIIKKHLKKLADIQLIEKDGKALTELGRNSIRVVLTGGVFDIIHPGHIHTLNSAKELGDVLVVVVATDKTAEKMKKRTPLHNQTQRKILVNALSMVDWSAVGHEGDIFKTVEIIQPEIIALGYDQIHQEKFITDGCRRLNLDIKVARLQSPIPEISSSKIEKEYGESIHDL